MSQVSVLATVEATVFTQVSFKFVWSYNSFIIIHFLKSHKSFVKLFTCFVFCQSGLCFKSVDRKHLICDCVFQKHIKLNALCSVTLSLYSHRASKK